MRFYGQIRDDSGVPDLSPDAPIICRDCLGDPDQYCDAVDVTDEIADTYVECDLCGRLAGEGE